MPAEPLPILAFGHLKPVRLWVSAGLRCAIYWGTCSFNGYVQLPPGHVDREFAEAYNEVQREDWESDPAPLFSRYVPSGYDVVAAEIHGGLTYGPDDQGWVGFDTAHAWDDWSDEEIEQALRPENEEAYLKFREMQLIVGPDMWPPGRHGVGLDAWSRSWTMSALVEEVESLAAQLARLGVEADPGAAGSAGL